jgi:hypothetical protein
MVNDLIYIAGFSIACLLPIAFLAKRFSKIGSQWLLLIFVVWLGVLIAIDDILWDAESESSPIRSIGRLLSNVLLDAD